MVGWPVDVLIKMVALGEKNAGAARVELAKLGLNEHGLPLQSGEGSAVVNTRLGRPGVLGPEADGKTKYIVP